MKARDVLFSAAGLLLFSIDGQAATTSASRNERFKSECAQGVVHQIGEENIEVEWQGKSSPYLKRGGWIFSVDALYWRANEEGLDYAVSVVDNVGQLHKPVIKWDLGFQAGLGYTFGSQDYWDLLAEWTHFNTDQTGSVKGDLEFGFGNIDGAAASVDWSLHYNTYDLSLGRHYFTSRTISLRPHFGLRGATINQFQTVDVVGLEEQFIDKATGHFWGIGLRAGTDMWWHFTSHWALKGSLCGALLYGHFNINQRAANDEDAAQLKQQLSTISPNLEAALGFEWGTFFSKGRHYVALSASYTLSQWWSQNHFIQSSSVYGTGANSLGLQGATFKLRFDF